MNRPVQTGDERGNSLAGDWPNAHFDLPDRFAAEHNSDVRADSWNNRGQAKMRLDDEKGAIADFRKALEISPGLQTARESLQRLGTAQ